LNSVVKESQLQGDGIHVKIYDFYAAEWIELSCNNLTEALLSIWNQSKNKDVEITDRDISRVLVLSEREYTVEAYWHSFKI
jgi:hypothetical protein